MSHRTEDEDAAQWHVKTDPSSPSGACVVLAFYFFSLSVFRLKWRVVVVLISKATNTNFKNGVRSDVNAVIM